jgi:hypothetical protein
VRNHVQHGGSIDHGYTSQDRWVDRPGGHRVRIAYIAPELSVERLRENPRFNQRVVRDLEQGGRQVYRDRKYDLRPFVRECVSGLGRVHLKIREMVEPAFQASERLVAETVARFLAAPGSDDTAIGLAVMELNDEGLLEGRAPLYVGVNPGNRRQLLQRRNHLPTHFDTQVITNEVELR